MKNLNVSYYNQIDNELFPRTSCYPSSLAMSIGYCLSISGYKWADIGCNRKQPEDFITEFTDGEIVKDWIKKNVGYYGKWILKYSPRTIAYVEEFTFNYFMNRFGFENKFYTDLNFDKIRASIDNGFPVVLHGNFRGIKNVKGHVVCCIGYYENDFIINDPRGDVNESYNNLDGYYKYYSTNWFKRKDGSMWGHIITI